MCVGLPLMGGSPMARQAVDAADEVVDAAAAPYLAPAPGGGADLAAMMGDTGGEEDAAAGDAALGNEAAANKATKMMDMAAMMAGSDEEEDDVDVKPASLMIVSADYGPSPQMRRRRCVKNDEFCIKND